MERDTDRRPDGWGHALVTLPACAYALLHAAALRAPAGLWGANLLAYYPAAVAALFFAVPLAAGVVSWPRWPGATAARALAARRAFPWVLGAAAIPILYLFRVRLHSLGDSVKWFAILENALLRYRSFDEIPWHNAHLDLPGLEFVNFQQAVDLLVHYAAYAVGHTWFDWTPVEAYAWVSCLAGGLYAAVLWRLAGELTDGPGAGATLFAFLASLGTIQLFFGYGESYTLVTLLTAVYLWTALGSLGGRRGPWLPALVLAAATATHMLAICLAPSWAWLAWRDPRLGPALRRRWVLVPLTAGLAVAAVVAYLRLYRGLQLPLLQPDEEGRYAILSLAHLRTLGNELLLLSPFGLVWGLAARGRRRAADPGRTFFGLAALGSGGLIAVHDITMGGRDWDLMSFPALPLALWGFVSLREALGAEAVRLVRRRVLPVAALHAALWVGVNASPERATARLESLLQYTNQSDHYRHWTRGFYYLEVLGDHPAEAAVEFQAAIEAAPAGPLHTPGTRAFSYRKFSANALGEAGLRDQALRQIREVYRIQTEPYLDENDIALHRDWARLSYQAAEVAAAAGDSARARGLYGESRVALERLATWRGERQTVKDLAVVMHRLGLDREAIEYRAKALAPGPAGVDELLELGDTYLEQGQPELAAYAYARLLDGVDGVDAEGYIRAGVRLYKVGHRDASSRAYRLALGLDPGQATAHLNLGWNLFLAGDAPAAIGHWREADALEPSPASAFGLGLGYLRAGQLDSARAAYGRAFARYGAADGARADAVASLDYLIAEGIQADAARSIRQQYWEGVE